MILTFFIQTKLEELNWYLSSEHVILTFLIGLTEHVRIRCSKYRCQINSSFWKTRPICYKWPVNYHPQTMSRIFNDIKGKKRDMLWGKMRLTERHKVKYLNKEWLQIAIGTNSGGQYKTLEKNFFGAGAWVSTPHSSLNRVFVAKLYNSVYVC